MILQIRVIPRAGRNLIREEASGLKVYLTKPAEDNLANIQLVGLLSEHLHVRKSQVKIIKGLKSRNKLIEVNG